MNIIKAIFTKQLNDLPKNVSVTLLYVLYPIMAFLVENLMNANAGFFAAIFGAMFVGVTPMVAISTTVAEDKEYKSLRFLVMAGVKPSQYLFGLGGFVLFMSLPAMIFFTLLGGFTWVYFVAAFLSLFASCALGATIGIFSKNVQQSTVIYMPFMLVFTMLPLFSMQNETLDMIAQFLFPYQMLMIAYSQITTDVTIVNISNSFIILVANCIVLLGVFIFVYRKKGLRY